MRLDERADRLGPQRRDVAVEDEDVAAEALERVARSADRVTGPERLLLHGDLDALEEVARLRRRDDDEPLDAGSARRVDDPVDHPPAEHRVQVLRRRALHARADPGGHHDCCELVCHVRKKWLGRQDSNLGSRDQNPLPYHLATPQGHGSLAAVEEEDREPDDGEGDETEDHQPLDEDGEQDENDGKQLRDDEDPEDLTARCSSCCSGRANQASAASDRERDDGPLRQVVRETATMIALAGGDPQREPVAPGPQPAAAARFERSAATARSTRVNRTTQVPSARFGRGARSARLAASASRR